jgi:hypothetical protein
MADLSNVELQSVHVPFDAIRGLLDIEFPFFAFLLSNPKNPFVNYFSLTNPAFFYNQE